MYFFSLSALALASAFTSLSVSAPTVENALVERATPADATAALSIVSTLYANIKAHTAVINSTASSLTSSSSTSDKSAAGKIFKSQLASIDTLVVSATSSIKGLPSKKRSVDVSSAGSEELVERQITPTDPTGLAGEITAILLELSGALNQIIATLGLTATLAFLGPLVASLSGLLASLIPVVNNLLVLVGALLDGVLGGLSLALAGLTL